MAKQKSVIYGGQDFFPLSNTRNILTNKIFLTLFAVFIFRLGNSIPLTNVDQEALKKAFLQFETRNSLLQVLNMYTGSSGKTLLSSFSLGIIPYINASIIFDLLTTIVPQLEKIQEEGESGRQRLFFYKKILSFIIAIIQTYFLLGYIKPYLYQVNFLSSLVLTTELVTGTMILIWLCNLIDTKGLGNGTSIFIFVNIVVSFCSKNSFSNFQLNFSVVGQLLFLIVLVCIISISQSARVTVPLISARQLSFLEKTKRTTLKDLRDFGVEDSGLLIKINQAGIFPIIIASNILPFLSYILTTFLNNNKIVTDLTYYVLILSFNYFYTLVFWDPEKISEQLRKSSVAILNITPGKETISYLEQVVRSTSLLGGIFLCTILFIYEVMKQLFPNGYIVNQVNISSLIIVSGVAYDIQRTIRAFSKNLFQLKTIEET